MWCACCAEYISPAGIQFIILFPHEVFAIAAGVYAGTPADVVPPFMLGNTLGGPYGNVCDVIDV